MTYLTAISLSDVGQVSFNCQNGTLPALTSVAVSDMAGANSGPDLDTIVSAVAAVAVQTGGVLDLSGCVFYPDPLNVDFVYLTTGAPGWTILTSAP